MNIFQNRNLLQDKWKLNYIYLIMQHSYDVVKSHVFKKDVYNAKIKHIEDKITDITTLATNTTLNAKRNEVKNEIPSIINLATTTALNAKIIEVKNIIAMITNLATTTAFTAIEKTFLRLVI